MHRFNLSLPLFALFNLLLVLGVSLTANAADAPAGPVYNPVQPKGWGLTLKLDNNGSFTQPGDEGWTRDDLDFLWQSNYAEDAKFPIYQVDGSTIHKDDAKTGITMTEEEFNSFFDLMTQELVKGGTIKILQSSRSESFGGRTWQVFNVEETQGDKKLTYYSFFTRDTDNTLRLVDIYYNAPEDASVYTLAATMLAPPEQPAAN